MPKIDFLPRKVLAGAHEAGVHADCVAAGVEGCCSPCQTTINQVMDGFYGHLSTEDAAIAIIGDLLEEISS